jgi:hypothetical protein
MVSEMITMEELQDKDCYYDNYKSSNVHEKDEVHGQSLVINSSRMYYISKKCQISRN